MDILKRITIASVFILLLLTFVNQVWADAYVISEGEWESECWVAHFYRYVDGTMITWIFGWDTNFGIEAVAWKVIQGRWDQAMGMVP